MKDIKGIASQVIDEVAEEYLNTIASTPNLEYMEYALKMALSVALVKYAEYRLSQETVSFEDNLDARR